MINSHLPLSDNLPVHKLASVFKNTVATYKFYWLLAIIEFVAKEGRTEITFRELISKMIANAWYSITAFKLSFGKSDNLEKVINVLCRNYGFAYSDDKDDIYLRLISDTDKTVENEIRGFYDNVPYWFLSPWAPNSTKKDIVVRSQQEKNDFLYTLFTNKPKRIVVNERWIEYVKLNHSVLTDFCYWNLLGFIETRNPNVPGLSNKLIKPTFRAPLIKQRKYWDQLFISGTKVKCIYTGAELSRNSYDIEHFVPWTFVTHDLIWNLIPSDSSINRSKSDKLPDLDRYLKPFVSLQMAGLRAACKSNSNDKIFEDFLLLKILSPSDLLNLDFDAQCRVYHDVLSPLIQIASNSGFQYWNK